MFPRVLCPRRAPGAWIDPLWSFTTLGKKCCTAFIIPRPIALYYGAKTWSHILTRLEHGMQLHHAKLPQVIGSKKGLKGENCVAGWSEKMRSLVKMTPAIAAQAVWQPVWKQQGSRHRDGVEGTCADFESPWTHCSCRLGAGSETQLLTKRHCNVLTTLSCNSQWLPI